MKKEDSIIYEEKPRTTSKWLIAVIIIVAFIFTIMPIVGIVYVFLEVDGSVYTEFEKTETGEILLNKNIKIYDEYGFYSDEEKAYYIQGYLENNSKNDFESLYIEYFVYDKDDVLLGTAYCNIDNLKQNTKWKYKAIYSGIDSNEISKFELSRVEFY